MSGKRELITINSSIVFESKHLIRFKAFIASPNAVNDFLNAYENIRYMAEKRYHLVHVVVLPASRKEAQSHINGILNHPTVRGCL